LVAEWLQREIFVRLETVIHLVSDIRFSDSSRLKEGVLFIDRRRIESLISREVRLADVVVARPGESVRIAPVLDVVEPRAKEDPAQAAFPGFSRKNGQSCGAGRTHILKGAAVVGVARIPGAQEGLIDMQRKAAPFSPFARTLNLVLQFDACGDKDPLSADRAIRESILRVAEFLGGLSRGFTPDDLESFDWPLTRENLPGAALAYFVQSQGNLRRTFFLGEPMDEITPALISPLQILDGAIVSGNFVMPCNKTCTYIHQNHPLIKELFREHGKSIDFTGVILANEMSRLEDKEKAVAEIFRFASDVSASGVLVNQEGGANTLTDVMMLCRKSERQGIKTVLVLNEFAGADGTTPSLAETTPEAGHIVSTGNNDFRAVLPPVEKFVGFEPFPGLENRITDGVALPLTRIHSSTSQLGFGNLSCRTDGAALYPPCSVTERPLRVVHYLNQFFGQIGGEDKAHADLQMKEGAVGPGLALKERLGDRAQIVATIICGDNSIAENLDEKAEAAAVLVEKYRADLLIAGPCFNAGRYGMACGAVCKAVNKRLGIPAVTGIAETNPAVEIYRRHTYMVPVGNSAAKMRQAVQAMVDVALPLAEGRLPEDGTFFPRGVRELTVMDKSGAARGVEMLAARLSGKKPATELPLPKFDSVDPAPPVSDLSEATIVLATEGGLTPKDNPDRIEMSMATKFGCYSLDGMQRMEPNLFSVAHGGYDNRIAREDPNRLLPLDVMREIEREKIIGRVAGVFYTTSGNATSVENAARFGKAISEDIRKRFKEKTGVVFTAT
jgi:glycine reductase